ncbi:32 KDA HEAT SHOCK PROTEIN-RELATED [Salix purpurea]|uniref:32 kDa HEAT SHOCK PROTEIN-RELATED n=1 Tax=Salix purpurea TaxID=77065 RepID=A0A9Q0Q3A4_SALPP|nr:32 KDA HEAT SHOCK PROTEIN-RELATED [Salix purpurea]
MGVFTSVDTRLLNPTRVIATSLILMVKRIFHSHVENEAKQPKPEEENPAKPDSKQKVKIVEPSKDGKPKPENDDSSDEEDDSSDDGESSDDQPMMMANDEDENSEDEDDKSDEDDDDSDDGDVKTPKKAEVGKKRSTESASKSPVPDKKAKFVTPQKTDFKKVGVHIATPHPSKQAAKTSANRQKDGAGSEILFLQLLQQVIWLGKCFTITFKGQAQCCIGWLFNLLVQL